MKLRTKRIYEEPEKADGLRILVDRLWPRGVTKEAAALDHWMKEIAPSTELRKKFHQDPSRWEEFVAAYRAKLDDNPAVAELLDLAKGEKTVTLLYSVRDPERNHAVILAEYLEKRTAR
jgi:uncharacterized protein YeaO (DUF488 family)